MHSQARAFLQPTRANIHQYQFNNPILLKIIGTIHVSTTRTFMQDTYTYFQWKQSSILNPLSASVSANHVVPRTSGGPQESRRQRGILFINGRQLLQIYFYSLKKLISNGCVSIQYIIAIPPHSWAGLLRSIARPPAKQQQHCNLSLKNQISFLISNISIFIDIHTGALTTTKTDQNLEILMNM